MSRELVPLPLTAEELLYIRMNFESAIPSDIFGWGIRRLVVAIDAKQTALGKANTERAELIEALCGYRRQHDFIKGPGEPCDCPSCATALALLKKYQGEIL